MSKEKNERLETWLADELRPELLLTPLSDSLSSRVVDRLKAEADRYCYINPNKTLEFGQRIIWIGETRNDDNQIALGMMTKGDAFRFLGQMQSAWDMLGQAGITFEQAGDEVGWARTRIGRILVSPDLNRVSEAFADADRAREIFTRHHEEDRLLRLDLQMGLALNYLGDQQRALEFFYSALTRASALGAPAQKHVGALYLDIGLTFNALGDFRQALEYYEKAQTAALVNQDTLVVATIEASIAEILYLQGQYKRALALLSSALEKVKQESDFDTAMIQHHIVQCYLSLNRNAEARKLVHSVIQACRELKAEFQLARTLLHLAALEGEAGNFPASESALQEAAAIFSSTGAKSWEATIRLWRGRIALRQQDSSAAYQQSVAAAAIFQADGQQMKTAEADLLQGQALLAQGNLQDALFCGKRSLVIAQQYGIPSLRYKSHLLLGQIAETQNKYGSALWRYQAAIATINRVQRGLTITLRPDFLEDKGEAAHHLISLYLRRDQTENAFEALEHAKAQNWLAYLNDRERLHWSREDATSRALIEELEDLRAEHHWFYQLANRLPGNREEYPRSLNAEQALQEMIRCEQRMRVITEQLYMRNDNALHARSSDSPSLGDIQQTVDNDSVLIEYYSDGECVWAFLLNRNAIRVHRLPTTLPALTQLVELWQLNIATALKMNPHALGTRSLTELARRILQGLHTVLIQPLSIAENISRCVFVPYGILHFLPFHLLYDGKAYLIENHEVLVLPAAALANREAPRRRRGVLALAHSWDGRLPHTSTEGELVQKLFGGTLLREEKVHRDVLSRPPLQILHIAAHGHHRLDQPDLSFLQLADGQLYADDVMQHELSYELITLSACETGRARIAKSDDLIGIGRSFLYAGAGALILSLWQVEDRFTLRLMECMYTALHAGASKPVALQQAQISLLKENKDLHPGFWGAFQIVGNPEPLSG